MSISTRIRRKLTEALAPTRLVISDDSERHLGHGAHHPDGESHFQLTVVSAAFEGQTKIARHRMVYAILMEELSERVHALGLRTLTPAEDT
jgi:BolA protein